MLLGVAKKKKRKKKKKKKKGNTVCLAQRRNMPIEEFQMDE